MEKISGILKNSPRVQSVDLREANPVRPGTPSFGRPEGKSALVALETPVQPWKSKDQKQAELAADLANRFFSRPVTAEAVMADEKQIPPNAVPVDSLPMSIMDRPFGKQDEFASVRSMNFNALPDTGAMLQQPDGYFPRGSFISRIA